MRIVIIRNNKSPTHEPPVKPPTTAPENSTMPPSDPSSLRLPVEPGQRTSPPEVIPADFLFKNAQEVLIRHNGELYRLRITRNDKLILTK
jgi:hemin uptake protein HemP